MAGPTETTSINKACACWLCSEPSHLAKGDAVNTPQDEKESDLAATVSEIINAQDDTAASCARASIPEQELKAFDEEVIESLSAWMFFNVSVKAWHFRRILAYRALESNELNAYKSKFFFLFIR